MIRWRIAILVSVAIAISYLDRQTLSVAVKAIQKDIPISQVQFADLNSLFLLAYACMYLGGGWLMDKVGTRTGFTITMVFWSLACASHGLARNLNMLAASRFLLGMGEGGAFPAATRVAAEWFPVEERSTAMGIMNGGSALGGVLAPPLIAFVLMSASWPMVFFVTGAIGLLWVLWWRLEYFPPAKHPRIDLIERTKLESLIRPRNASDAAPINYAGVFGYMQLWGLVLAKFLSDAAWYFYLFWLPKYLYDARGFDIKSVGAFAWIPYAAAGLGCLVGGWFSGRLIKKKCTLDKARKLALGLSAAVMPLVAFVTHVPIAWALAIFSVAYFGQQSWSTLIMILPTDLFPSRVVGTVAGMVGFGGAMGGIVFLQVSGHMLDGGFSYGEVFAIAASFHVIAFVLILVTVPIVRPLQETIDPNSQGVA